MNLDDLIADVRELVTQTLAKAKVIKPTQIGLDPRAAWRLYATCDYIAVDKKEDRNLQYYGGFEYVDKDLRQEIGDFVFYSAEAGRVADHLEQIEDL